jgi:hypothetical protein
MQRFLWHHTPKTVPLRPAQPGVTLGATLIEAPGKFC